MTIHIATPELVVLETESGELTDSNKAQMIIRSALEVKGIEQWSSIEIEDFTYQGNQLIFAKPVKVFIHDILARLIEYFPDI
ncbi:MAG: hypothetical protein GXY01_08065 [Clostridiales bacterium]|jgi:hypothetical protein|nr:hypothetical protein [Clostridiales bacterium]